MANVNKVILIGNVTRDVEVKTTPKGTAVAGITLAVNRNYKTDSGEKREEVTFVDVELWGRVAEIAGQYVKKGNPLYVEGRLKQDSWEDKDSGQKRTKLKVVAENIQLLGSRPGAAKATEARPVEAASPTADSPSWVRGYGEGIPSGPSDDIPF
jgi:single-strand DNA-binding protein